MAYITKQTTQNAHRVVPHTSHNASNSSHTSIHPHHNNNATTLHCSIAIMHTQSAPQSIITLSVSIQKLHSAHIHTTTYNHHTYTNRNKTESQQWNPSSGQRDPNDINVVRGGHCVVYIEPDKAM